MSKVDKINKLENACSVLKSEFVGLDDIIDKLKMSITPWYVTPEVLERPVVVSLWGMTGTGKTSIIHRLIELLDLDPQALFFDCGSECKDGGDDLTEKIRDFITNDMDSEIPIKRDDIYSFVMVFDEFQYARTIDENGDEVDKPNLRPVWNILDSGKLRVNQINKYDLGYFNDFVEDFSAFASENSSIPVSRCTVDKDTDVKKILDVLGFFYYDRGVPDTVRPRSYGYDSTIDLGTDDERDVLRPLTVIEDRLLRIIYRKSGSVGKVPEEINEIMDCKTIGELADVLKKYKTLINVAEEINCSKSIVFVVGNLDEAFKVSGDFNPDVDADVFYDETSRITDADIKASLKCRFRAEQVARFGNALIKYPTLTKDSFNKIIRNEVSRIKNKFEESEGVKLVIEEDFYDLLYSEGVYPVQGVRPVFTTIGTTFTPLLSKILVRMKSSEKGAKFKREVKIGVIDPESGYKLNKKTIYLKYRKGKNYIVDKIEIELSLGTSRNPKNRKTVYINSVHEAGHAIVMSYLTGTLPVSIVSVSTDHGGFCITYDKNTADEINSKRDIDNEVKIGLAGYEAEQLIYGSQPDRTLLGSGSDLATNWDLFSRAVYESGYFNPYSYSNHQTESSNGGPAAGLKDDAIYEKMKTTFESLKDETIKILTDNKKLLIETALVLGEKGEMRESEFKEMIGKYGNTLNLKRLDVAKDSNSYDWYKDTLLLLRGK